MTERLVVLDHEGTLKLYSINGDGPELVGTLVVGALDEHTAAMVGAAFADLRAVITAGQLPPARRAPVKPHGIERYLPEPERTRELPRPRKGGGKGAVLDPSSLNGRVRAHLTEHGPSSTADMLASLDVRGSPTKTATQRLGTSLSTLKRAGWIERTGSGRHSLWRMRSERAEPTPARSVLASKPHGRVQAQTELDARALLGVLDRHPEGLGGLALFQMARVPSKRRHGIDLLVSRGLVRREGNTRGATWHRVTAPAIEPEPEATITLELEP